MAKSLCRLVILVNHALVTNFDVANMSFYAIHENKVLVKISGFTVVSICFTGWSQYVPTNGLNILHWMVPI